MTGKKIDITTAPIEDLDKLIAQLKRDQAKSKKPVKKNKGGAILMSPRKQMACGGKVHK
tara:strand:- start:2015 stop:2191 length:177 start_codon:yes stop_codon:yes gene_type:complete